MLIHGYTGAIDVAGKNSMSFLKGIDSEEFTPMNTELSEFFVEELEQRLETDPLIVGGLLDLFSPNDSLDGMTSARIDNCDGFICGFHW